MPGTARARLIDIANISVVKPIIRIVLIVGDIAYSAITVQLLHLVCVVGTSRSGSYL